MFKIVPMLNPDGVIVGNYRCSLQARDLNRNYRWPKHERFPTIWNVKKLVERLQQEPGVSNFYTVVYRPWVANFYIIV